MTYRSMQLRQKQKLTGLKQGKKKEREKKIS